MANARSKATRNMEPKLSPLLGDPNPPPGSIFMGWLISELYGGFKIRFKVHIRERIFQSKDWLPRLRGTPISLNLTDRYFVLHAFNTTWRVQSLGKRTLQLWVSCLDPSSARDKMGTQGAQTRHKPFLEKVSGLVCFGLVLITTSTKACEESD